MKKPFNYRHKILLKRLACRLSFTQKKTPNENAPTVTIFISSLNTREALELTIRSLRKYTRYPNYQIVVGDNGSTDGSVQYLEELEAKNEIQLIKHHKPRRHYLWLDDIHNTCKTPYWFAIDSDMLFLGYDAISEMVAVMESDPDIHLVAAEKRPPEFNHPAPKTGEPLDLGEAPSTWLMAIRTSLREKITASFQDGLDHIDLKTGKKFCYDTGGKLLKTMRDSKLKYHYMPKIFQCRYQHFGGLSWSRDIKVIPDEVYQRAKKDQLDYIRQCLLTDKF